MSAPDEVLSAFGVATTQTEVDPRTRQEAAAVVRAWLISGAGPDVREGAYLLRKRAESFSSDAEALRHHGNTDDAPTYDVIARELRAAAEVLDALARPSTAHATTGAGGKP